MRKESLFIRLGESENEDTGKKSKAVNPEKEVVVELKEYLEKIAKTGQEVENIYESSGGNYDDAYSIGLTNGEVGLAKELLEKYFSAVTAAAPPCP